MMRSRGSKVADIAVLVVAADEGVQEQTIEAIKHIQDAKVNIIIAINKCDKPNAKPDKIRQQLLEHNIIIEDFGGEVMAVNISALTGKGLDDLEQAILLTADVLDLKANPDTSAEGTVVESSLSKGWGPIATVIVRNGTLRPGDIFVIGATWGKIRFLHDASGKTVKQASPSTAVQVIGLKSIAEAGEDIIVVEDEHRAKEICEHRMEQRKAQTNVNLATVQQESLQKAKDATETSDESSKKSINLIIKADTGGGIDAVKQLLDEFPEDVEVELKVISTGIGMINESDVLRALTSKAIILGFNTNTESKITQNARQTGVPIYESKILYEVIDRLRETLTTMLTPNSTKIPLGAAEVLQVFTIKQKKEFVSVAGCRITKGSLLRNQPVRVYRNNNIVFDGKISSLKHVKDDINEAKNNTECGLALENWNEVQVGDVIQNYRIQTTPRKLGEYLVKA